MRMHKVLLILGIAFCFGLGRWSTWVVSALGPVDPPTPPGSTLSYSLNYLPPAECRDGRDPGPIHRAGGQPGTGTTYSLNEVMAIAPAVDDANGAGAGQVLSGRKFWGLRSGSDWGLKTGTMALGGNVTGSKDSCVFRGKLSTDSNRSCPPIPTEVVQ